MSSTDYVTETMDIAAQAPSRGRGKRDAALRSRGSNALEHEVRRRILEILRDGERAAGDIRTVLGRRWAGVSHHLTCLRFEGLVSYRREGASLVYRLNRPEALAAWSAYVLQSAGRDS